MKIAGSPFHTHYRPRQGATPVVARRPILARALRADVVTPQHGPVLVWGEPLIGKSTLLRQVLWSLEPSRFLVARLPLGALAQPLSDYSRAVRMLADQIGIQLESRGTESVLVRSARSLTEALDHSLAAAESSGRTLVLAIEGVDRYVGGVWPTGVKENLDTVISRVPTLGLILTSRSPMSRLGEIKIPEHVRIHFVGRLDATQSGRLLTEPVASWLSFDGEALQWLLAAAGGRPFLLQIMGRNTVRVAGVLQVGEVSPALAQEVLTSCWLASENLFRPLLGNLHPGAQHVLAAVALATSPERPTAKFEVIFKHLQALNDQMTLTSFGNELSLVRLWRLVESDEQDAFWVGCGWLADYLRAA